MTPCIRCAAPVPQNALGCPGCGTAASGSEESRPATMVLMGLSLAGCPVISQPDYGISESGFSDYDGDGYSIEDGDCDDDDPDIHPDAEETAGDGVDSNCDGEDDT